MKPVHGFTLIELLIVIGIATILLAVIFVAVNPVQRFGQVRDTQRLLELDAIIDAVYRYAVNNGGSIPPVLDAIAADTYHILGTASTGCDFTCGEITTNTSCLDLSGDLVDDNLPSIPFDPITGSAEITHYFILKTASGRIRAGICNEEILITEGFGGFSFK